MRLPLVLTIGLRIQCLFAFSLRVPFSASSSIQLSIGIISLILLRAFPGEFSEFKSLNTNTLVIFGKIPRPWLKIPFFDSASAEVHILRHWPINCL